MSARIPLLAVVFSILEVGVVGATDTAFWTPYSPDANTYILCHFNKQDFRDIEGMAAPLKVEKVGDAVLDPAGRFGGSLQLRGHGALRLTSSVIFAKGNVSIEAWIKLERYPEREAYIVCRPAVVDQDARYDPEKDRTKGFALLVDSRGALHLETTNCFYGKVMRTSSPAGAVPLSQWVHVAGISDGTPVSMRRLFVNGREIQAVPVEWGQGITVGSDEERQSGPIYVGNNAHGTAGLDGRIDELRIHGQIVKFWPRDDGPIGNADRPLASGPPHFIDSHAAALEIPLDGNHRPTVNRLADVKIEATGDHFAPGIRGKAWLGPLSISAPKLLDLHEGSIEFWLQPVGVNNWVDNNRSFIGGPFILYFVNDGGGVAFKPMTLYFATPQGLHFLYDSLETEFRPGTWYHLVITWKDKTIVLYINGRQSQKTLSRSLATAENRGVCTTLQFSPNERIGLIDEIRLYPKALLADEAANAYWRYRDPGKLVTVQPKSLDLKARFLPSLGKVCYQCAPNLPVIPGCRIRLALVNEAGKELHRAEVPYSEAEQELTIPRLEDGLYRLTAALVLPDGKVETGDTFTFASKHFPWEKNTLGVTDEVEPPFEPVRVSGDEVSVVGRTFTMNGFGLWNRVVSLDHDLLAAPIRLRFTDTKGEATWSKTAGQWNARRPNTAVYRAEATADALRVATTSTIEVDGCMKVEMELLPGPHPAEVRSLWIDIPLRAEEVPLMHTIGDGVRSNYSGRTPEGRRTVWDGSKSVRSPSWRNAFTPYVWLGAEQRGLCWFGENDRGWVTEKSKSKAPIQELIREDSAVVLRVYLINRPITLVESRKLCFGMQVSPTKPMPINWRRRLPDIPTGLAVVPFGGLQCPSQGPLRDDWSIVDKILQCRSGKPLDEAWLADYVSRHRPALVHGSWSWASSVGHFANRARDIGSRRPLTVYHEEMAAAAARPEYAVFQDEWDAAPDLFQRTLLDPQVMQKGYSTLGRSAEVTFGPSYRDFGSWFANEWLARGVSLYWDNTFPHLATNPRTSDAYTTEDGEIQPCLILWNQREYQKRVWNLLEQWRRKRPEPLEWVIHMTNTLVLPLHTWGTADLDHEFNRDDPFPPDWLRTETIGLQVGNFPLSLYAVSGSTNRVFAKLAETTSKDAIDRLQSRVEWAMRAVHEIQRSGPLEKYLTDFGYGSDRVTVHRYWDPAPVATTRPDAVRWLVVSDRSKRTALAVLASWSPSDVQAEISFDEKSLGFKASRIADAETGAVADVEASDKAVVKLPAPYGVRLLRINAP